jgi:recombination protein RecR
MQENDLQILIKNLGKMPGLGPRSGRRLALHLLNHKESMLKNLIHSLKNVYENIVCCGVCHNLDIVSPCHICTDHKRDPHTLCIVENVADLWAMERSRAFLGRYHVLGGVLSQMDGIGPEQLNIRTLSKRLEAGTIDDVTIALSATVDGQTTLYYLAECFKNLDLKISTLAHGVPIGGELDYLDDGTLTTAFRGRRAI